MNKILGVVVLIPLLLLHDASARADDSGAPSGDTPLQVAAPRSTGVDPCAPKAASATESGRGSVKVHIESPRPVELYAHHVEKNGAAGRTERICTAPCDRVIDGWSAEYFSVKGGDDMSPSPLFTLRDREKATQVDVKPGPRRLAEAGAVVLAVGLTFGLGAIATFGIAGSTHPSEATKKRELIAGGVLGGLFVLHLPVGLPMALVGSTDLRVHDLEPKKAAVARKPRYWAGEF